MMQRLGSVLRWWPVERAIVVACLIGLVSLGMMIGGVVFGTPLWVVASMSVAQGLGVAAGVLFAVSVAADAGAKSRRPP